MIQSLTEAQVLFDMWQGLKNDKERIDFLILKKSYFKVFVDNDMVFVNLRTDEFIEGVGGELEDSDFSPEIEKFNEELNPFDNFGYNLLNEVFVAIGLYSDFV